MPERKPVLVQLTQELLSDLDAYAEEAGRSRSAVIRDAVERYVLEESEKAKDRRLVEGYRRIPDSGEFDAWAEDSARQLIEEESW